MFLFTFGSEILTMVGDSSKRGQLALGSIRCVIWVVLFLFFLRVRSRIAKLSDADLSVFLSMSTVKGGLIVGLGQLAFIAFSSIQCASEAKLQGNDWKECKRSLLSQTGLGGLVGLYTVISLVSSIAPKRYIDRHTIKLERIAIMDLNVKETVEVLGLSITAGCGLFLLGNYGVEGTFADDSEEEVRSGEEWRGAKRRYQLNAMENPRN